MIYFILLFSFFFELAISNIISPNSLLVPLFTLVSLSLIWPYFKKNNSNFIIVCAIVGLLYDLIFTSMPFVNTISFSLISLLIIANYSLFKYNIISSNIFNIFLVSLYRVIGYFLLVLIGYLNFDFEYLIVSIYKSIIINVAYGVLMYIIIDLLANIFDKKNNNTKIKKM